MSDDDEPSDRDWMRAAECVGTDLDGFEAYLWPVYRDRGVSKGTAMLCFYLHLLVVRGSTNPEEL